MVCRTDMATHIYYACDVSMSDAKYLSLSVSHESITKLKWIAISGSTPRLHNVSYTATGATCPENEYYVDLTCVACPANHFASGSGTRACCSLIPTPTPTIAPTTTATPTTIATFTSSQNPTGSTEFPTPRSHELSSSVIILIWSSLAVLTFIATFVIGYIIGKYVIPEDSVFNRGTVHHVHHTPLESRPTFESSLASVLQD